VESFRDRPYEGGLGWEEKQNFKIGRRGSKRVKILLTLR